MTSWWPTPRAPERERRELKLQWLRAIAIDAGSAEAVEELREAVVDLIEWLLEEVDVSDGAGHGRAPLPAMWAEADGPGVPGPGPGARLRNEGAE